MPVTPINVDYDSAQIITQGWGTLLVSGMETGNHPTLDLADLWIFTANTEWHSGDIIGADYTVIEDRDAGTPVTYLSLAKKLGKFPLGGLTDGKGAPYVPWASHARGNADGNGSVSLPKREGAIRFAPGVGFANGNPSLRGRIPRAATWFDTGDMLNLIWDNTALLTYTEVYVGTSALGAGPNGGGKAEFPYTSGSSHEPWSEKHVLEPRQGHILRMVLFRWRRSSVEVTPTHPDITLKYSMNVAYGFHKSLSAEQPFLDGGSSISVTLAGSITLVYGAIGTIALAGSGSNEALSWSVVITENLVTYTVSHNDPGRPHQSYFAGAAAADSTTASFPIAWAQDVDGYYKIDGADPGNIAGILSGHEGHMDLSPGPPPFPPHGSVSFQHPTAS